jgi:monoamine oxidase
MGNGVANKIFVSFEKPFWDVTKKWVDFISAGARNRYPFGVSIVQENRFILCMFISGDASKQLNELSDEEIINDLVSFLSKFNFKEEIKVRAFEVTRWEEDPFSLGSYSYMNMSVGMTKAEIDVLRSPIDNKLWFIGEHCHS